MSKAEGGHKYNGSTGKLPRIGVNLSNKTLRDAAARCGMVEEKRKPDSRISGWNRIGVFAGFLNRVFFNIIPSSFSKPEKPANPKPGKPDSLDILEQGLSLLNDQERELLLEVIAETRARRASTSWVGWCPCYRRRRRLHKL